MNIVKAAAQQEVRSSPHSRWHLVVSSTENDHPHLSVRVLRGA